MQQTKYIYYGIYLQWRVPSSLISTRVPVFLKRIVINMAVTLSVAQMASPTGTGQ